MPRLRPDVHYLDHASSLIADPKSLLLFCRVSTLPFAILAISTWLHLRGGEPAILRRRFAAVIVTFVALFALAWYCYMPQTVPGFNFGVVAFPIYAAMLAPVAYGLGRLAAFQVRSAGSSGSPLA